MKNNCILIQPNSSRKWIAIPGVLALSTSIAYAAFIEPSADSCCFVLSVTGLIVASIALLFRRVWLACFVAGMITWLIGGVSYIKQQLMHMGLHAYDFVLYLNVATLKFVWSEYRIYLLGLVLILVGGCASAAVAWRLERPLVPRAASSALLVVTMVLVSLFGSAVSSQRPTWEMFTSRPPISYFYLSWSETLHTLLAGQIMEADLTTDLPSFAPMPRCNPDNRTPHILLIHEESLFPPGRFPTLDYDHSLDPFFLSDDQKLHKLRVEIYGGGSWMSEFSLLTGLSTNSFGDMRAFLQVFLRGKLKQTLPQVLLACGFRNQVFMPVDETFVGIDRFYRSIGLDQIFDKKAQGSTNFRERDRFYFVNALAGIERELRLSDTPTFTFMQTMASHGPYDTEYMPGEDVSGGGPGTSKEMNEYLRRLAMAKLDYEFLVSEIKRRFPDQPFLIVRYGDHQPSETRPLVALTSIPDAGLFTFYAMTGVNYNVPPLPQYESIDIPFLGTIMLDAARIPLPQSYDARKAIMNECRGVYYNCEHRQDVLAFQGRLIHSGLIGSP